MTLDVDFEKKNYYHHIEKGVGVYKKCIFYKKENERTLLDIETSLFNLNRNPIESCLNV